MHTYVERPKKTWAAGQWWPPDDPRHEPLPFVSVPPKEFTPEMEFWGNFARLVWQRAQGTPGSGWTTIDGPMMSSMVFVPPGSFVIYPGDHPASPPVRVFTAEEFSATFVSAGPITPVAPTEGAVVDEVAFVEKDGR
jgi:hypothetical protein